MNDPTYSSAQRVFHWISALLIVAMGMTGMMYFWEIAGKRAILAHQIIGQILIIILILRLITKWRTPRMPEHAGHADWERGLARITHSALYAALIVFVITGYVAASALLNNVLIAPLDLAFARGAWGETLTLTHYQMK